MIHELKIKEKYYEAIKSGKKTFEIRKNDRNYQVGDLIRFTIVTEDDITIPARSNHYQITYILPGGEYGINEDYCILGIAEDIDEQTCFAINIAFSKGNIQTGAVGNYNDALRKAQRTITRETKVLYGKVINISITAQN